MSKYVQFDNKPDLRKFLEKYNSDEYEYLVLKYHGNWNHVCFDKRQYSSWNEAVKDVLVDDCIKICKKDSIYYGDNFSGWCVSEEDVVCEVSYVKF